MGNNIAGTVDDSQQPHVFPFFLFLPSLPSPASHTTHGLNAPTPRPKKPTSDAADQEAPVHL